MNEATQASIGPVVAAALAEDVGAGDLTAQLVDENAVVGAQVIAREPLVVCGEAWVDEVFRQLDDTVIVDWYIGDGGAAEGDRVGGQEGAAGELDRQVLDKMLPPFEHMLRNAVVHGIEPPEERQRAEKPATGRITIPQMVRAGFILNITGIIIVTLIALYLAPEVLV